MITIQKVRVRWSAASRGAPHAAARRGLNSPLALPVLPPAAVVLHDVVADEARGYERTDRMPAGGFEVARKAGLWLEPEDGLPGCAKRDGGRARKSAKLGNLSARAGH